MPPFITVFQMDDSRDCPGDESNGRSLLIATSEIRCIDKPLAADGPSRITLKTGEQFIVSESIKTIAARLQTD